jgi:hypothetical protein
MLFSLISGFVSPFTARQAQIEQCIAAEAKDAVRERDTGPCLMRACLFSGFADVCFYYTFCVLLSCF